MKNECGSLAQLGEHMPYKHRVTGSIPVAPTIFQFFTSIKAQWRSWLARQPVTLEVEGSSPFWVAICFACLCSSVGRAMD